MASKPQTYSLLAAKVRCATQYDAQKSKTYGRKWQRIRRSYLARNPLCVHCLAKGVTTPANQVDHILRIKWGGGNEDSNLQALCASCHSKKTQAEERRNG